MEALFIRTANKVETLRFGQRTSFCKAFIKQEFETPGFWRAVFAEFLAQTIYVFLGCMSVTPTHTNNDETSTLRISLSFGFAMTALFQITGHISGGHINPAITLALGLIRKISVPRCGLYLVGQFMGGLLGGVMAYGAALDDVTINSMIPHLSKWMTMGKSFANEIMLTFIIVIVFISCTDTNRAVVGHPGVIIGLTVTLCHVIGIRYSGAGLNPSRHLGPAVAAGIYTDYIWIYSVGPFIGSVLAAFVYKFVLNPSKVFSKEEGLLQLEGESRV